MPTPEAEPALCTYENKVSLCCRLADHAGHHYVYDCQRGSLIVWEVISESEHTWTLKTVLHAELKPGAVLDRGEVGALVWLMDERAAQREGDDGEKP